MVVTGDYSVNAGDTPGSESVDKRTPSSAKTIQGGGILVTEEGAR